MNKRILKWILSAFLYLGIVIGGYYGYDIWIKDTDSVHGENGHELTDSPNDHGEHSDNEGSDSEEGDDNQGHGDHGDHGGTDGGNARESEVIPVITYNDQHLNISFLDMKGNPVTKLEITHEKLVHLIIVNDTLEEYLHLHPTPLGDGSFEIKHELSSGSYIAFADIKPEGFMYSPHPVPLKVGQKAHHTHDILVPDATLSKIVEGVKVTMEPSVFKTNEEITLSFSIDGGDPEPYLGALGHVVILDEKIENFVHVHPLSDTETNFATSFNEPGLYKIWGEFQFNGRVHVYPFVVEVVE
jgi:hypothetical protein